MRTSSAIIFAAASLVSQVSATLFVTAPVAGTTCTAGTPCAVNWDDNGATPALGTIGVCSIDLCTGGPIQQTCLQNIAPAQDVSQIASIPFNPIANIGASGVVYFIKFSAATYKDPANPTQPFTAFSHTFALAGMTGTFNSTVQAQIDSATATGAATSALAATSAAATSAAATAAAMTTVKAAATTSGTAKTTTTAAAAKSTSGALNVAASFTSVSMVAGLLGLAALGF